MAITNSRGIVQRGLEPNRWVVLFEELCPCDGPVYFHNRIALTLEYPSDPAFIGFAARGGAAVRIILQESADGITWTLVAEHPQQLQPGGVVGPFNYYHVRPHVRCLLYSTAAGKVVGTLFKEEIQSLPALVESPVLDCATLCEQVDET